MEYDERVSMSIDFTNCVKLINDFGGSEKKKKIIYNNEEYMIKFPDPIRERDNNLSYMNNQFSEYIGCHIFELCGIKAQKTLLGTYKDEDSGKIKVVVGCRSFQNDNLSLIEFNKIMLSINTEKKANEKLELNDIIETFKKESKISDISNLNMFFNTIVIDTLIGNGDRHEENFGFVYDKNTQYKNLIFSPIYDCGSCLAPLISDERMKNLLNNESDFKAQEYNLTYRYCNNGKKIFMHEFFNKPNNYLSNAIVKMFNKIDLLKINNLIDNTEYISDVRKEYCKKAIKLRYDTILKPAYLEIHKFFLQANNNELLR